MSLNRDHSVGSAGASQAGGTDVAWKDQGARPVVFAVEPDPAGFEIIVSTALGSEVRCEIFKNCAALAEALADCTPDLVLLDVTTEATNAVEVLHTLSTSAYPGILQLTSQPGVSMVEPIRQLAQLHSLQVLPPLSKPLDRTALTSLLGNLNSKISQSRVQPLRLDEAIRNGWVRFWYQPKISLQKKSLVGLEAFIRLFHPHKGLMPPAAILKNADDESLRYLLHHALVETQAASAELLKLGLSVPISINATLKALQSLPTTPAFRDHVATTGQQRNWVFDVSEEDIAKNRSSMKALVPMLRAAGVRLAIDNFSGRILPRATLDELPISELKLSPKFVAHCHTEPTHADVCKALIHLAHDLQSAAVAIGVETSAQSQTLQRIGCDVGQGFLYSHPLPLEQLLVMVRQRAATQRLNAAASTS